jgi:hypothetical protein
VNKSRNEESEMVAEVAALKIGYDGFSKLLDYFGKRKTSAKLQHQIDAAWRELLKGDALDDSVIEAALAAAQKAGDTSVDHLRLNELFKTAKATKTKATVEAKKKAPAKKPATKTPKKKVAVKAAKRRK